jgi:hypothetical protein
LTRLVTGAGWLNHVLAETLQHRPGRVIPEMRVHQLDVDRSPGLPDCFQKAVRFVVFDHVEDPGQEYH